MNLSNGLPYVDNINLSRQIKDPVIEGIFRFQSKILLLHAQPI